MIEQLKLVVKDTVAAPFEANQLGVGNALMHQLCKYEWANLIQRTVKYKGRDLDANHVGP